jgi:hypothetical protein
MQVSIEMDEDLVTAIDRAAGIQEISRNVAFAEALRAWVAHKPKSNNLAAILDELEYDPDFVLEVERPGPEAYPSTSFGEDWPEPKSLK